MVRYIVLRPGAAFFVPIKKYQVSRTWLIVAILPLAPVFKPIRAACASGELGDHPSVNVAALVGTPADKAGAPLHPAVEAVPAPVGLAAHVAHLGQRHGHDLAAGAVEEGIPHITGGRRQQLVQGGVLLIRERIKHPHIVRRPGRDRDGQYLLRPGFSLTLGRIFYLCLSRSNFGHVPEHCPQLLHCSRVQDGHRRTV